ncbi:MAG: PilZ domain-containing protein [Actinomycetota bacterium]
MSISQRQHIRFSLDLPAIRFTKFGDKQEVLLHQISIGGCLLEWEETILTGEVFRLEILLPNGNFLPLTCKVLYKFEDNGIGAKFVDITKFEQELLSRIISHSLSQSGLPMQIDPFSPPPKFADGPRKKDPSITDNRKQQDEILEKIMSSEI